MNFIKSKLALLIAIILSIMLSIHLPISFAETSIDSNYSIIDKTVAMIIEDTIAEFDYDPELISIAYYDFNNFEHYYHNSKKIMLGASATKVGTAALFMNLINNGELTMESEIPYIESMYEPGAGNITNGPNQSNHLLSDLIYEMLYYSDNTAWNLLTYYYYTNYGNYQNALLTLSGAEIHDSLMYEFNHIDAEVLEGLLIELASSPIYQPVIDIMLDAQDEWLMKTYINEGMATKYGNVDSYFHDIGIYFEDDSPIYALVIMTDSLGIGYESSEHEFFSLLNLRINRYHEALEQ